MNPTMMMKWAAPTGRKKPTHCDHKGCKHATREGKPYCSEHVEQLDYVREVQGRIEAREVELVAVAKRGAKAVDVHGIVAREVLCSLWTYGERSVARLSRELNVDFELLLHYVVRLRRAKLITQTSPRRGAGKVKLVPALAALDDPRLVGLAPSARGLGAQAPRDVRPASDELSSAEAPALPAQPLALEELSRVQVERKANGCG